VDANANRSTYAYDHQGHMVETVEAATTAVEAKTQHVYDANGNRTRVIHPRTFSEASVFYTDATFTGRNLLATQTAAATTAVAATESFTYWPDGRQRDHTDARGTVTTSMWSHCCGYHRASADPAADNDNDGNTPDTRAAFIDRRDSENRLVHAYTVADWAPFPQDPAAPEAVYSNPPVTLNESTTRYDNRGRPVARTVWLIQLGVVNKNDPPIAGDHGTNAADGLTTRWVYDDNLTDGIGLDATYAAFLTGLNLGANAVGSAVEVTNPVGDKTVSIHDGLGRTVRTLDGLLHATTYSYDTVINGLLETRVTDALNHVTKSRADGAGRVRESEDQLAQVSVFSYDNNGNRISFRDANGVGQDCIYDARNRDTQCTDTAGSVTKKFYDTHNNLVKTTDALLKDNLCAYDARDRKINCTDRLGGVTQYAYDVNNNLTTLTDAQSGVTSYVFDPRNLLIVETYPDNGARTYVYDAARRLIKRVDQSSAATGYAYDHAGRMVERAYPAGTGNDTFVYDNASRLTSAASTQYNNSVSRTYDSASRITSETLTVGATPYNIGYAYDADNRQTHVTYPDGSVAVRNFTDRNQLSVVTFNNALVANFAYDNAGRKVATGFGNGITEARTYQADNLNTSINTPGVTAFGYTWDANKRKLTQTETGIPTNDQTYAYDNEDRLASFNRNNGDTQTWNLSLVGDWNQFSKNGVLENRTHNAVHEITTIDANPLVHDVKGNLATNKNGQTYAWDIENRLVSATVPAGCPDGIAGTHGYTYDALGRRVSKTVGGNTTVFVSDGMQEIAEYVNGAFSQSYVYGSYIDEPLLKTDNAGNKIYYHANNLFSIAALTDAAGNVVERYKYDPYGKQTILAADGLTVRTASLYGNPWQDRGRRTDLETGLQFYRNRMWDMNLGRFTNRDPLEYVDGCNMYQGYFVPNGVDPQGYFWLKYHGLAVYNELTKRGYSSHAKQLAVIGNYTTDMFSVFSDTPLLQKELKKQLMDQGMTDDAYNKLVETYAGLHFDNLANTAAIDAKWAELEKKFKDRCGNCDPMSVMQELGSILHAYQDFYAHSNWAEVAKDAGYTPDDIPSYSDWKAKIPGSQKIPVKPDLFTGKYPDAGNDPKGHDSMNKDNPKRPNFDLANAAMQKEMPQIMDRLEGILGTECIDKLKGFNMNADQIEIAHERLKSQVVAAKVAGKYE
jgi:RHS repeat-associated protein